MVFDDLRLPAELLEEGPEEDLPYNSANDWPLERSRPQWRLTKLDRLFGDNVAREIIGLCHCIT